MSALGCIVGGSLFVGTCGAVAYLGLLWKLPDQEMPWAYIGGMVALSVVGLFLPWVTIAVVALSLVIALVWG